MRIRKAGMVIIPYDEPGVGTLGVKITYKKNTKQSVILRGIQHAVLGATGVYVTPKWLKANGLLPTNHGNTS